jgi:hypothetical protein
LFFIASLTLFKSSGLDIWFAPGDCFFPFKPPKNLKNAVKNPEPLCRRPPALLEGGQQLELALLFSLSVIFSLLLINQ